MEVQNERLIHSIGTPRGTCWRADTDADAETVTQANGVKIKWTAKAYHAGNVDCPLCLEWLRNAPH